MHGTTIEKQSPYMFYFKTCTTRLMSAARIG